MKITKNIRKGIEDRKREIIKIMGKGYYDSLLAGKKSDCAIARILAQYPIARCCLKQIQKVKEICVEK